MSTTKIKMPMNESFVHLQCHSEYSLVDGLLRMKSWLTRVKEMGMPTIAITDQDNLFGIIKFYQTAIGLGLKPIIGSDVWFENNVKYEKPFKMTMLCQNLEGYKNLTNLISRGYMEGQKNGKPVINRHWLKDKTNGLLMLANSRESDIALALLDGKENIAAELLDNWNKLFPDRFYLCITRTGRDNEHNYLKQAILLAEKKSCPLVATNEVRFLKEEDFEVHKARVCIQEGVVLTDTTRKEEYTAAQYLKSSDEMKALFYDIPEAIQNTVEIAKRCNLFLDLGRIFLPNFTLPDKIKAETYLIDAAKKGLNWRLESLFNTSSHKEQIEKESIYQERLLHELKVINNMGFASYFLIVADFINWARKNEIPVGPGRGSGAGSLVAYALRITNIDPIKYELLFERFLNHERVTMPDFDIDFCIEGRDRVINYVSNKYGRKSVSQIITFGSMTAKAVIRDVGRVLGHSYSFIDQIAKLIPLELGITLDKALKQEELLKLRYDEEDDVRELFDLAKKLEGTVRNVGKHAGGIVIAPSKLTDYTPLYCEPNEKQPISQFDKNDVEIIGLVKFDFLGLRTLTIIRWALETINANNKLNKQPFLNINVIPLKDSKTFQLLCKCLTTAIFQFESRGMKDLIRRLQPNSFEDIIALVALFRPGPLQSGMVADFISRKNGISGIIYPHPDVKTILQPTYGVILYQEQVMQIAQVLAGYTLGAADLLRRAMSKKKHDDMLKQRKIFTSGAINRGVDKLVATNIFNLMEKFAGYGFNKSHSAAYALLSYQTAWLKAHHPAAFMAAVLSSDMSTTSKIVTLIEECHNLNIKVIPPDINRCLYKFTTDVNNRIIYGLGAIKGVGDAAIACIIKARENGTFKDIFDFCTRVNSKTVTKRVIEALTNSGAFDKLGFNRAEIMYKIKPAIQAAEQIKKHLAHGQVDLFENLFTSSKVNECILVKNITPWNKLKYLQGEKATLGFYLTDHPITNYLKELKAQGILPIAVSCKHGVKTCKIAGYISELRTFLTKRGDRMAFISLDDGSTKKEIAIFPNLFSEKRMLLKKDNLIIVEGDISPGKYAGDIKVRARTLVDLETARVNLACFIRVRLNTSKLEENFVSHLAECLKAHSKGICALIIECENNVATVKLRFGKTWLFHPTDELLTDLLKLKGIDLAEFAYSE